MRSCSHRFHHPEELRLLPPDPRVGAARDGGERELPRPRDACRIANVVMAALAPGLKERSAATDGASHSNFLFGGADAKRDEFFCCYDLKPVGWGGRSFADGNDAAGGINGNCPHISVEVFEFRFPWHVEEFKLGDGSGGPGKFRGRPRLIEDRAVYRHAHDF